MFYVRSLELIYAKLQKFYTCCTTCLCVHAKLHQSCPTLCYLTNYTPPGSSVCGILRQEYWKGLPFPLPGYLLYQGIEPASLVSFALEGRFFTTSTTWEDWRAALPFPYFLLLTAIVLFSASKNLAILDTLYQ